MSIGFIKLSSSCDGAACSLQAIHTAVRDQSIQSLIIYCFSRKEILTPSGRERKIELLER